MSLVILFILSGIIISLPSNAITETYDEGPEDFSSLVKMSSFVDKTLLIKEFLNSYRFSHMVRAPRRFGKSMNMDMIKRFLEAEVDKEGNLVPRNLTRNYKLFTTNNLKIFEDKEFFDKYFGKYPVIYLDFKELNFNNYSTFLYKFNSMISREFIKHDYLLYSSKFGRIRARHLFTFYKNIKKNKLNEDDLCMSVKYLSELLYIHFNKTICFVLIDEFDAPVHKAINSEVPDFEDIYTFIMLFTSDSLKSNSYVSKSLLNARIPPLSLLFMRANNIIHIPFLSKSKFSEFYGLTDSEVKYLLTKYNMSDKYNEVKLWYGGYQVEDSDYTIYNTYDIKEYIQHKTFRNYWVQSGGVKDFGKLFALKYIRSYIQKALNFREKTFGVQIAYKYILELEDVQTLHRIITQKQGYKIKFFDAELFLQYLTEQGYFSIQVREGGYATIRIPNKEIETELQAQITS